MKIFIKSFNRPYYLDRCLQSIYDNVIGENLDIVVLDDGTKEIYLSKLKNKYPTVEFKLSNFYEEKIEALKELAVGKEINKAFKIPSEFWLNNILNSTEPLFMLLEDDMWFKGKVDISECIEIMYKEKMCILKMFHSNNPAMFCGEIMAVNKEICIVKPKLFTSNSFIFKLLFTKTFLKIDSINRRLRIFNYKNKINYYTIYNVAGAIFTKDYYDYLWKEFEGKVDEDKQLVKAIAYNNLNKNKTYGLFSNDIIATSFSSSATNMFQNIDFNIFTFNQILNNSWLKEDFDPMKGYPLDIDSSEIARVLEMEKNNKASVENWRLWSTSFKTQYRNVGHIID